MSDPDDSLTSFDKDEWRDVARKLAPHLTDEQFDEMWDAFDPIALKERKRLQ